MDIAFELQKHQKIHEGFQQIKLMDFSFSLPSNMSNDIDLLDIVKSLTEDLSIKRRLDIELLHADDFKKLTKGEISEFLVGFINEPDWGDDRNDFARLLDSYFPIHSQLHEAPFYVIDQKWFQKVDNRVENAYSVYIYCFLITMVR